MTQPPPQKTKYSISQDDLFNSLNFKYDDFDPKNEKYHPKFHKRHEYIETSKVDLLNQNRYRYIISPSSALFSTYTHYKHSSFSNISWSDIVIVFYSCIDVYQCPICLEHTVTCPMLTSCGHIFCWPCLINFTNYFHGSRKKPKCPLCNENIDLFEYPAKFCEIVNCTNYSTCEKNRIQFNLVMRNKKSQSVYNIKHDPDLSVWKKEGRRYEFGIPFEKDKMFSFSRVFYSNDTLMKGRYLRYKKDLEDAYKDEESFYNDDNTKMNISLCIQEIDKMIQQIDKTVHHDEAIKPLKEQCDSNDIDINYNNYYFMYQEQYGDIYYLHPLIFNILMTEYGTVEQLPTFINGTIVDIEMHQVTFNFKNKYPYLNHLMIGSIVFFVEIDVKHLVSFQTKKKFNRELNERQRFRNLLHNEEKNYEQYIKKKVSEQQKQMIHEYAQYNKVFHSEVSEDNENEHKEESDVNKVEDKQSEVTESALKKLLNEENVPKKKENMVKNEFVFEEEEFPAIDNECKDSKNVFKKKGKKKGNKNRFTEANIDIFEQIGKGNNNDSNSNENNNNNTKMKNVSSEDIASKSNSLTAKKQQHH